HRHGHGAASADPPGADLRRPDPARRVRFSHEAAHADQAWLQEPQAHPGDFRDQHLPGRLLGRPGLQLVRRELGPVPMIFHPRRGRDNHEDLTMNKLSTCVFSMCLALAAGSAFAADQMARDGMAKDGMSKSAMSRDGMGKHEGMSKDGMAKNGMSKSSMSRDGMGK